MKGEKKIAPPPAAHRRRPVEQGGGVHYEIDPRTLLQWQRRGEELTPRTGGDQSATPRKRRLRAAAGVGRRRTLLFYFPFAPF